jgi:hypothetical protein
VLSTAPGGADPYYYNNTFKPLEILSHTLHAESAYGVMTHYWSTGEIVNWDTVIDYYVDGEETPSISLMEDMACGQGYPKAKIGTFNGNGAPWHGETPPVGTTGTFAAGEKMGKSGQVGGYYHYHKILFQKSIRVTARTLGTGPQVVYIIVRGHEVASRSNAASGLTLPSGFTVPPNAKLQLQRLDNVTYTSLEMVPLVTLPKGYAGLLYLTTFATQTIPAGNAYIEGCWHLFPSADTAWPGVVLGTGVEDYFDSAYYFCALGGQGACLFAHPTSGLLHFSRLSFNGTDVITGSRPYANDTIERISAYRFFDQEVVGFSDGGKLEWRVGDVGDKCGGCPPGTKGCKTAYGTAAPVAVRTYAWLYTWPLNPNDPPAPNNAPITGPRPLPPRPVPGPNTGGEWVGPVNGTYSDAECPNLGCHGGPKTPVTPADCEKFCDEKAGCDAYNFSPAGSCCLRSCLTRAPPPKGGTCCAYYYELP